MKIILILNMFCMAAIKKEAKKETPKIYNEKGEAKVVKATTQAEGTKNSGDKPSVGRIVHYINNDGEHQAAIIVKVNKSTVNLLVFTTTIETKDKVKEWSPLENSPDAVNTYHFPERV